jgi:hypothetical protein
MKIKSFLTLRYLALPSLLITSCSSPSNNKDTTARELKSPSGWDYQKIREARQAAQEQDSLRRPSPSNEKATLDCVVLSEAQKKRSRASGCRPLDPNAGHGENMFCCDREL